jgi:predicted transcriptional regulator
MTEITEPGDTQAPDTGVFAICQNVVERLSQIGLNELVAYTVIAAGTGGDHQTTAWSAQAVSTYTGMRWPTAKHAIESLMRHGAITHRSDNRRHPRYRLLKPAELIWIPKTFITGAAEEKPPIRWLRESQSIDMVHLMLQIYGWQNLADYWGVPGTIIWQEMSRERIIDWRDKTVFAFCSSNAQTCRIKSALTSNDDPWDYLRPLFNAGLLEWVDVLFEGPQGGPIHPLKDSGDADHIQGLLNEFHLHAADQFHRADDNDYVIPVAAHFINATVIRIARTRYRAQTELTAEWYRDYRNAIEEYEPVYEQAVRGIRQMGKPKRQFVC